MRHGAHLSRLSRGERAQAHGAGLLGRTDQHDDAAEKRQVQDVPPCDRGARPLPNRLDADAQLFVFVARSAVSGGGSGGSSAVCRCRGHRETRKRGAATLADSCA